MNELLHALRVLNHNDNSTHHLPVTEATIHELQQTLSAQYPLFFSHTHTPLVIRFALTTLLYDAHGDINTLLQQLHPAFMKTLRSAKLAVPKKWKILAQRKMTYRPHASEQRNRWVQNLFEYAGNLPLTPPPVSAVSAISESSVNGTTAPMHHLYSPQQIVMAVHRRINSTRHTSSSASASSNTRVVFDDAYAERPTKTTWSDLVNNGGGTVLQPAV